MAIPQIIAMDCLDCKGHPCSSLDLHNEGHPRPSLDRGHLPGRSRLTARRRAARTSRRRAVSHTQRSRLQLRRSSNSSAFPYCLPPFSPVCIQCCSILAPGQRSFSGMSAVGVSRLRRNVPVSARLQGREIRQARPALGHRLTKTASVHRRARRRSFSRADGP